MTFNQTLHKAKQCIQRGQYDAAIRLYRGLLRMAPRHPIANGLLGVLLIQVGQAEAAVSVLEVAHSADPTNQEHWIVLLGAYHRTGRIRQARRLLTQGEGMGVEQAMLDKLQRSLSEPPEVSVKALQKLINHHDYLGAEIAARMMAADYPDSEVAQACLAQVLQARELPATVQMSA